MPDMTEEEAAFITWRSAKTIAEGIRKVFLVAFRNNEDGNAFWESQGFALREDLSYRDKVLMEMLRIDT